MGTGTRGTLSAMSEHHSGRLIRKFIESRDDLTASQRDVAIYIANAAYATIEMVAEREGIEELGPDIVGIALAAVIQAYQQEGE